MSGLILASTVALVFVSLWALVLPVIAVALFMFAEWLYQRDTVHESKLC